jgi:ATP-dependent DNA helicase RecG
MKSPQEITVLLDELEDRIADELEEQDLDFKQWDGKSQDKAVKTVVQMAVCMANGGGGTVVFGVADAVAGRQKAILGVPPEIDINLLKKAVYDQTDPKIMPVFEALQVPEGTGRLLVMQIHPGLPPYTDTAGKGTIRIGKDCQPLTGTLRRKIAVETGESDFTAEPVALTVEEMLSPTAMEQLRRMAGEQDAPEDLLALSDHQLLQALGVLSHGKVSMAAILLCGNESAIRQCIPGHHRIFLRMVSDTQYDVREDNVSAIPLSVARFEDMLLPFNPITTVEQGPYHFEYRTYPQIAFREAVMNAFCHADYRIAGPVLVKLFADSLVISNNGGFIAGITPDNILHHQPATRNPMLVEALTRLRLVNRSNLGVSRIYSAFLMEGKRPPILQEIGDSVSVTFLRSDIQPAFRRLVADYPKSPFNVDELMVLNHIREKREARESDMLHDGMLSRVLLRKALLSLTKKGVVTPVGEPADPSWRFSPIVLAKHANLLPAVPWETQIWELLRTNELTGMNTGDLVKETGLSRSSVKRLLGRLQHEGLAEMKGRGAATRWFSVDK